MARAATNLEDPSSDTSTSVETQCGGASGFSTDSAWTMCLKVTNQDQIVLWDRGKHPV